VINCAPYAMALPLRCAASLGLADMPLTKTCGL